MISSSSTTTKTEYSREIEMDAQSATTSAVKSVSSGGASTSYPLQGSGSAVKIEEITGPIYNVERKHEYPKDVPPREEAKGKDNLKFPVYGVEKSHSFVDKAPYHESEKILQGPSYDVQHTHKFTKEDIIATEVSSLSSGPVYKGVESQHKFPEGGKDSMIVPPNLPTSQKYPVTDSDHSVKFNPPLDKKPPLPKELLGPKFKDVNREHSFTGIEKDLDLEQGEEDRSKKVRELVAPVYTPEQQDQVNRFKEVIMHAEAIRTLQGPVYEAERNHHFQQLMMSAQDLKNLTGPVYDIDKDHHFQELITHAFELKNLVGPIYSEDGGKNAYLPDKPYSDTAAPINAPVYGVQSSNSFQFEAPTKIEPDPMMIGPKLPCLSANKYSIVEAKVEGEVIMATPGYRGMGIENRNQYFPEFTGRKGETLMLGPKLPNVEESHKYGPVPSRVAPRPEMQGPVYPGVEGHNQFSKVLIVINI